LTNSVNSDLFEVDTGNEIFRVAHLVKNVDGAGNPNITVGQAIDTITSDGVTAGKLVRKVEGNFAVGTSVSEVEGVDGAIGSRIGPVTVTSVSGQVVGF
jgi:hypothetical protein